MLSGAVRLLASAVVNAVGIRNLAARPQEADVGDKDPISATPA